MSKKVVVKQVRSAIGSDPRVLSTLRALGLGRPGKVRKLASNPSVDGQIRRVAHLVEVAPLA